MAVIPDIQLQMLRAAANAAPIALFSFDTDLTVTLSEGGALPDIGYASGELVGRNLGEMYAGREEALALFTRALAGERFVFESTVNGRDLETWWGPLYGADGTIVGGFGVSTDVTPIRQLEHERAATAARNAGLATLSKTLAAAGLDPTDVIEAAARDAAPLTEAAVTIRLLTPQGQQLTVAHGDTDPVRRARTQRHLIMFPAEFGRTTHRAIETGESLLLAHVPAPIVEEWVAQSGIDPALLPTSLTVSPLRARGGVLGFVAVTRFAGEPDFTEADRALHADISDRVALALSNARLLDQARHNEERYRIFEALVENSPDLVSLATPDRRIMYLNPAGRVLVGLEPDIDLSHLVVEDFHFPEDRDGLLAVGEALRSGLQHWEGERRIRNFATGETVDVEVSAFPVVDPITGAHLCSGTIQRDIRQRKASDRELMQVTEQRQALLAHLVRTEEDERRRFAEDLHDDTIQVIAATDLRLQLLRRRLAERADSDEMVVVLDRLHDSVQAATRRLRQLLSDLLPPSLESNGLVASVRAYAQQTFADSGVEVEVVDQLQLDPTPTCTAMLYRSAQEALLNVLKHAGARHVRVVLTSDAEGTRLTVVDDGRGIDLPVATVERPGHLGLPSLRERAAVSGGRFEVRRLEPHGTAVEMWLPRQGTDPS